MNTLKKIDQLDPAKILQKLLKYWYWVVLSLMIGITTAVLINRTTQRIYQADSILLIKDDAPTLGIELFNGAGSTKISGSVQNEIVKLQTYSLAYETVRKLDINVQYFRSTFWREEQVFENLPFLVEVDWNTPQLLVGKFHITGIDSLSYRLSFDTDTEFIVYNNGKRSNDFVSSADLESYTGIYRYGQEINSPLFLWNIFNVSITPGEEMAFSLVENEGLGRSHRAAVQITPFSKESSALKLSYQHPSRQYAVDYLNTLMEVYLEHDLKERSEASEKTVGFIDGQLVYIGDSLRYFESELEQFRTINKITDLSTKGSQALNELVELENNLNQQRLRLKYYQNLQLYLKNPEGKDLLIPSVLGIEDPLLNNMVNSMIQLQTEKSGLEGVLNGSSFAYLREINSKIESLRINLDESVRNAILNINTHIARLQDLIALAEGNLSVLPSMERSLLNIERKFKINESIYVYLLEKRAEANITKASMSSSHKILDFALSSYNAVTPNTKKNLLIGVSLGILFPLIGVIFLVIFYNKIEDPKDIAHHLDNTIVGYIGKSHSEKKLAGVDDPHCLVTESFRSLRSNLAFNGHITGKGTILVTSSRPGEGKTFTSINLASVYASLGMKTLLVGLDLRRPTLARDFGVSKAEGITSYMLADETKQIDDYVQLTQYTNLYLLPSGPIPQNPSQLINSHKFHEMISRLKLEFDIIVIDTPPVSAVSETLDLIKYSDIQLYVLRQNFSYIDDLQTVNELTARLDQDKLLLVLNDISRFQSYSYRYNTLYSYGKPRPKRGWKRWRMALILSLLFGVGGAYFYYHFNFRRDSDMSELQEKHSLFIQELSGSTATDELSSDSEVGELPVITSDDDINASASPGNSNLDSENQPFPMDELKIWPSEQMEGNKSTEITGKTGK